MPDFASARRPHPGTHDSPALCWNDMNAASTPYAPAIGRRSLGVGAGADRGAGAGQVELDAARGGEQRLQQFLDDFPTMTREVAIAALEQAKAHLIADARVA